MKKIIAVLAVACVLNIGILTIPNVAQNFLTKSAVTNIMEVPYADSVTVAGEIQQKKTKVINS
ncbi:MAG: hypothetical protein RR540_01260, partial [Oscillospiraceae bacterium]